MPARNHPCVSRDPASAHKLPPATHLLRARACMHLGMPRATKPAARMLAACACTCTCTCACACTCSSTSVFFLFSRAGILSFVLRPLRHALRAATSLLLPFLFALGQENAYVDGRPPHDRASPPVTSRPAIWWQAAAQHQIQRRMANGNAHFCTINHRK